MNSGFSTYPSFRVGILGAGAIGSVLAAKWLEFDGTLPHCIGRSDGLRSVELSENTYEFKVGPQAAEVDLLVVCTKSYQALEAVESYSKKFAKVVYAGNGVLEHLESAPCFFGSTGTPPRFSLRGDGPWLIRARTIEGQSGPWNALSDVEWREQVSLKRSLNAVINPLCVAVGARRNGELLNYPDLIELVCSEVSSVMLAGREQFLNDRVLSVLETTRDNQNSMICDVLKGQATEIDAIFGTQSLPGLMEYLKNWVVNEARLGDRQHGLAILRSFKK